MLQFVSLAIERIILGHLIIPIPNETFARGVSRFYPDRCRQAIGRLCIRDRESPLLLLHPLIASRNSRLHNQLDGGMLVLDSRAYTPLYTIRSLNFFDVSAIVKLRALSVATKLRPVGARGGSQRLTKLLPHAVQSRRRELRFRRRGQIGWIKTCRFTC